MFREIGPSVPCLTCLVYMEKVPTGKFYSETAGAVMTTMYEVPSVGAVVIQSLKPDLSVILIFLCLWSYHFKSSIGQVKHQSHTDVN